MSGEWLQGRAGLEGTGKAAATAVADAAGLVQHAPEACAHLEPQLEQQPPEGCPAGCLTLWLYGR
jgi:hypothetical protein